MKKSIALVLALCLVLTVAPTIIVSAANEPELLFEMQYSGTDGDAVSSVTATTATADNLEGQIVTTPGNNGSDAPIYKEETGADGESTIKYLKFAYPDGAVYKNTYARVAVPMDVDMEIINKEALTFETWVRPNRGDGTDWFHIFTLGNLAVTGKPSPSTSDQKAVILRWWDSAARGITVTPDFETNSQFYLAHTGETNGNYKEFNGQWVHIVVTREWTPSNDAAPFGAGTWKSTLYINGKKKTASMSEAASRYNYKKDDVVKDGNPYPWNYLTIGGHCTTDAQSFKGDIATFKMYEGVFEDETVINQKYMADMSKYREMVHALPIADVEPDATSVEFELSNDVDVNTFKAENISVVNSEGRAIGATLTEYDAATRRGTIAISDFLGYGERYELHFTNVLDATGEQTANVAGKFKTIESFGTATVGLTSGGAPVSSLADADKVEVSMPVSGEETDKFAVALIVRDASGRGVNGGFKINELTGSGTLSISTNGITLGEGYSVKAIAWKIGDSAKGAVAISKQIVLK